MINLQQAEKPDRSVDGSVEAQSVFATFQGEGPFTGRGAVFVRLSGCNLSCNKCDTDYTSRRAVMSPAMVLYEVKEAIAEIDHDARPSLVVLTGGEPFRQNTVELVQELLQANYEVQVETNGTLDPGPGFPWSAPDLHVVCSPKAGGVAPVFQTYQRRIHWKYVVQAGQVDGIDGLPTSVLENGVRPWRPDIGRAVQRKDIWVVPMDDGTGHNTVTNLLNRRAAVASCRQHGYRLSQQLHKAFELP